MTQQNNLLPPAGLVNLLHGLFQFVDVPTVTESVGAGGEGVEVGVEKASGDTDPVGAFYGDGVEGREAAAGEGGVEGGRVWLGEGFVVVN